MKRFFFLLALIFFSVRAEAATVYVDPICSNGTKTYQPVIRSCVGGGDLAYQTISAGVAAMSGGDTLYIRAGTYGETITSIPSGTAGQHTVIASYGTDTVTFNRFINWPYNGLSTGWSGSYIDFVGGCTTGINRTCRMIWDGTGSPVYFDGIVLSGNVHHITFDGVRVTNWGGMGHNIPADNNTWRNCRVDNNARIFDETNRTGYNYYMGGSNNLIENCEIDHAGAMGIHMFSTDQHPSNNVVRNNLIHFNGDVAGANGGNGFIVGSGGSNNQIYGNSIFDNFGSALQIGWQIDLNVYNNTIYNNGAPGDYPAFITGVGNGNSQNVVARNNAFFNNHAGNIGDASDVTKTTTTVTFSNNACDAAGTGCSVITATPGFVAPASGNFNLTVGSPLINVGTTQIRGSTTGQCPSSNVSGTGVVITVFDGPCPDIGAYEYQSSPPPPVVTITQPVGCSGTSTACTVTNENITLSGTTSGTGINRVVTWTCTVGGVNRCGSGGTTSPVTAWTTPIVLKSGENVLDVNATDSGGAGTDRITVTYAPTFPGNTLAGAWPFNEGSGATVSDVSGNANNGTLQNGATRVVGNKDVAVSLNGSDQYILVPDSATLDFTRSFTLSIWVNPSVSKVVFTAAIVKNFLPYVLYATSDGSVGCSAGSPVAGLVVNGNNGTPFYVCADQPLQPNRWTHLAATYDFSTLKLYVDGVLGGASATIAATGYMDQATEAMQLGASQFGEFFQGMIASPRVYNFALPLSAGTNTVPNAPCTPQNRIDQNAIATASIIGSMNCSIITPTPPLPNKWPASASGLKASAANGIWKWGTVP